MVLNSISTFDHSLQEPRRDKSQLMLLALWYLWCPRINCSADRVPQGLGCQDFLFAEKRCVCISKQERQILSYQNLGNGIMLFPGCVFARLALSYVIALARCTCFIALVSMIVLSGPGHHSEDGNGQLRSHQEQQPEVQCQGGQGLPACPPPLPGLVL